MPEIAPLFVDSEAYIGVGASVTVPEITYSAGDLLLLVVMSRGPVTIPSGWVAVQAVGPHASDTLNRQRVSVYERHMTGAGAVSVTVEQAPEASPARLCAAVLRFSGAADVIARNDLTQLGIIDTDFPVTTEAKGTTRSVVWAPALHAWSTSSGDPWTSTPEMDAIPWPNSDNTVDLRPRLGVFIDDLVSASRQLHHVTNAGATAWLQLAAVELVGVVETPVGPFGVQTWPRGDETPAPTKGVLWPRTRLVRGNGMPAGAERLYPGGYPGPDVYPGG